jgi:hypothetical protein
MKLMIFTPTWIKPDGEDAMHPECRRSIEAQKINGKITWVIGRDNPFGRQDSRNVPHQYKQAQAQFLAGDYDALLTVEHDNVLPDAGAAQRLIDTPADVVYGVYMLRHGMHVLNAWRHDSEINLGMSLSNYPDELAKARAAGVWRVSGVGNGCTLIRRNVLKQIKFRDGGDGQQWAPDMPFAEDALRAGIVSMARFDVQVGHVDGSRVIWPYEFVEQALYIARETVNAIDGDNKFRALREGEPIRLTINQALPLVAAGYLRVPDSVAHVFTAPAEAEPIEAAPAETPKRKRKGKE